MDQARHSDDEPRLPAAAGEGTKMTAALRTGHLQRYVLARGEQLGMTPPQSEKAVQDEQLLAPVSRIAAKLGDSLRADLAQQRAPPLPIDRPAIIGVDEVEVPKFTALIDV